MNRNSEKDSNNKKRSEIERKNHIENDRQAACGVKFFFLIIC
jgi:hypothetical protein